MWISKRKKKAIHKTTTTDGKITTLKMVVVNTILGIEEVNIVKDDLVIQFQNLKCEMLTCYTITSIELRIHLHISSNIGDS